MAALNWTSLQTALLAETAKVQPPYTVAPADFAVVFPLATSYAEGRIYKEFGGLLATRQVNTSLTTLAGNRQVSLSNMVNSSGGPIIVPERFALVVGTNIVQFERGSLAIIDMIWPQQGNAVQAPVITDFAPRYWDLVDDHTIVYCPTADQAYPCQIEGMFQPTPIGPGNETPTALTVSSTYLSTVYPELLLAGCMIHLCGGLLHNFGAQGENPARALSWESVFSNLMASSKQEEMRRRGLIPNYPTPAPMAQQPMRPPQ
jgi:hypothetical protein